MWDINEFAAISISLVSPEDILEWSHGEVSKSETINYRTLKPERDGLFCEKIFGSTKDWECYCGKFKSIRYKGVTCDRCGVEVTHSKVRRERMGHIQLVAPVSHIWYFKGIPSRLGVLLDMSVRDIERVLYYEDYIVLKPGKTDLEEKDVISEEKYREYRQKFGRDFEVGMGAESVQRLLKDIKLARLSKQIKKDIKETRSQQKKKMLIRRYGIVEAFRKSGNKPEWMVLNVVPVIPPELRPMVQLDGGRFATSDLNDLYRRVINRNNRLKRLLDLKAPEIIIRNEKRMLQEAVDALLDNGRRGRIVRGPANRPLKSLSDMLKGKQGRFRQNLLGKRVDYSGRSVIVVGPDLKLDECGLPKKMALELFKPFIMHKLVSRQIVHNIKSAKRMVDNESKEVWDVLEEVIEEHPVLLNRAPTLHRLGVQAFQPVLIEGKALRIHPLVCTAFNADFDGDQMAVHVPLSIEAIMESKLLMLASNNILSPANGKPIISPTQDIVLGCYYLTKEIHGSKGEGKSFSSREEVLCAYDEGHVSLHASINVYYRNKIIQTTPGRLIFNSVFPDDFEYVNKLMDKKELGRLFDNFYRNHGPTVMMRVADYIKKLGFRYATLSGISISVYDMKIPEQKDSMISDANGKVAKYEEYFEKGIVTEKEKVEKIIDVWQHTMNEVGKIMIEEMKNDAGGMNPIYLMSDSGARGSADQIKQLAGMRGLVADPSGKIRETPIRSNFREGHSVLEFFQSTNGSRKGLTDTALKTANAGYLTRRLVDVAQDCIVSALDCGTPNDIEVDLSVIESEDELGSRILGRVAARDIILPELNKVLVKAGAMIEDEHISRILKSGLEKINKRSVLTCEATYGVCQMCYGRDMATGKLAEVGEAVGVIAAQSIGEPGTQLTLRTFHTGGIASAEDNYIRALFRGIIEKTPDVHEQSDGSKPVIHEKPIFGRKVDIIEHHGKVIIKNSSIDVTSQQDLTSSMKVHYRVKDKEEVKKDQSLLEIEIPSDVPLKIRSIRDGLIIGSDKRKETRIQVPPGFEILVKEKQSIKPGEVVARFTYRAPFRGVMHIKKSSARNLTVMEIHSMIPEIISASYVKKKLAPTDLIRGADIRISKGSRVELDEIIAENPNFEPYISSIRGIVEFKNIKVQTEGKEEIVIKPEHASGEYGTIEVWKGKRLVIDEELQIENGAFVDKGTPLSESVKSPVKGQLFIVRKYTTRTKKKVVYVVKIIQDNAIETFEIPYLKYSSTAATTARGKSISKIKKAHTRTIAECHLVISSIWRKHQKQLQGFENQLKKAKAVHTTRIETKKSADSSAKYETWMLASGERIQDIIALENNLSEVQSNEYQVQEGTLLVKKFSDFLKIGKRGDASRRRKGVTQDIVTGLPRVEELFEVRNPKQLPAVISKISGVVQIPDNFTTERKIIIFNKKEKIEDEIEISMEKHLIVENGDEVFAGDPLTDGPVAPRDILAVKGQLAVQKYIVEEVQDVYKGQGVEINNKHIEIIVRQMLRKVQIDDPGDTSFLVGDQVDKYLFNEENKRVKKEGGQPATAKDLLLGITKASKYSDSFISASSFQETTWALTEAAIRGKRDELRGLKENVIIGHLIPAGTGLKKYRQIELLTPEPMEREIPEEENKERADIQDSLKEYVQAKEQLGIHSK